ncbi:threonylcarbamoyl-AMP synthase [Thermogymnomonas acidicola]|uniref:Threonylcarbamoyl-AMP synthase n=2 Tax=Thermogymnomonas acidicola TaxID=399579 RepID=A0AA37F9L5_9ARCH|nr:threonylcarbamoyl-AMP synthase [Thermogymnomonas acidicola]
MEAVRKGASVIKAGGTVIFPTETVYGLGANALSAEACLKVFRAKNRPADNPLIVHVCDMEGFLRVAENPPEGLVSALKALWPGPLTVLVRKRDVVPDVTTGGSPYVAVRMPDNPLALALIRESGVPIAAPSANLATRPSIVDSSQAIREMYGRVDLIYDCGPVRIGVESTILDMRGGTPRLLRPGGYPVEFLERHFGEIEVTDEARGLRLSPVALTPGMKYRHYSPSVQMFMADVDTIRELCATGRKDITVIAEHSVCGVCRADCIDLGLTMEDVARNLFSAFLALETRGSRAGFIQKFGEGGLGLAIMNRIRKASSGEVHSLGEALALVGDGPSGIGGGALKGH